jgi:hypothetical protein
MTNDVFIELVQIDHNPMPKHTAAVLYCRQTHSTSEYDHRQFSFSSWYIGTILGVEVVNTDTPSLICSTCWNTTDKSTTWQSNLLKIKLFGEVWFVVTLLVIPVPAMKSYSVVEEVYFWMSTRMQSNCSQMLKRCAYWEYAATFRWSIVITAKPTELSFSFIRYVSGRWNEESSSSKTADTPLKKVCICRSDRKHAWLWVRCICLWCRVWFCGNQCRYDLLALQSLFFIRFAHTHKS